MMNRFVVAFACLMALALPAAAQNPDVVGTWEVNVVSDQGNTSTGSLVLKKDGDKLVGTLTAPQGDMPVEATVKEKAVTIRFTVPTREGALNVTMNGAVDSDTMKGTMDIAGREGRRDWSAKRSAAAAPAAGGARLDVSGTWTFAVETGAGSGTPAITLKQDGEKLTGQYHGQLGEAPLTGSVKGTAIEFAIDVSVQGNAIHIVYTGTADKDAMKGTVKFGDLGDGTFTATKTK